LLYQVRQGSVIVVFRGQYGMEDVKAYSDSNISFVVDTVANDLRLQHFVAKWVSKLRKEKYLGSWTLKKELRKDKLKTLDKLNKSLEKQYQDSVKYGKHRSVKNPRKYGLGKVDSFIGMIHNQDNFYSYGNARSHYNKHYKYEDGNK